MDFEIIIVGGSFAGISAAMQAARARRKVLVIDKGLRRNRFAPHSHGFLGQDGRAPADIIADAKAQLMAYPSVVWRDGQVKAASGVADDFRVTTEDGATYSARRLVLATGMVDNLPEIPGLNERWGKSVFICPYCDGYELNQGQIAVLATSDIVMHQAMLLPDWGPTTLLTNGNFSPDAEQRDKLAGRGVKLETQAVVSVTGERVTVNLSDGRALDFAGLFTVPRVEMASDLAAQLGCGFEDSPTGPVIQTDSMKKTSVPGVYAAGDTASMAASVAFAVRDGALAGAAAQQSMIFGA